jgi:PAS domain S-box-containing protein
MNISGEDHTLVLENARLREHLAEAEAVIRAIRQGEIDAVVVSSDAGDRVFTMEGADYPYRTLVESMSEGAATLSEDGAILYCNPRLAALLGTSAAELTGTQFVNWVEASERVQVAQLLSRSRDGHVAADLTLRQRTGEALPVHASLSTLRVGESRCCCAVLTDLSLAQHHAALAEAAEAVRRINDRLREADRRKDEFLATLAHELRNPLAPIRAAAAVLKRLQTRDPQMIQAREMIDRQAGHMTRLIDDLLEVSRITQGKIELQRRAETLSRLIGTAVESAQGAMDARGHRFVVNVPEEPMWLSVDSVRIVQAIANVIDNAAKYTPAGGRIELLARRDGLQAVVSVRDNGVGIAPDMAAPIFEMFVQAQRDGHLPRSGLGIGLALSRRLIELHGGSIVASSEGLGRGAEFTIRLPLSDAAASETDRAAATPDSPIAARRVLIVDDNADAADSLCTLLQLAGHTVKSVYRGEDALQALEGFQPDVMLLDIGLPDLDGYEVARRVRVQRGARCPSLIALSGWGQLEDKELAREAGIDLHLTKPVDASTLERALVSPAEGRRR